MTLHITRQAVRAICLGDIDADWAAGHTLDHLVQFKIFHAKDTQVAIIARQHNPMLSSTRANPDRYDVVYQMAIEAQDHVWVDILRLVLKAAKYVVEASIRINLFAEINALIDYIQL